MPTTFILIFIVVVTIMVMGGIYSHRQQQERQAALALVAHELNWHFDPSKDCEHDAEFGQFGIFTKGQSRYGYNTLRGSITIEGSSWPGQMGDYHYKTTSGSGKNRRTTTHLFSYLIVKMPYSSAPGLKIRREQLYDRVAGFIGFEDIDFESAEFSDRFHVKSPDKRFAYDVIHPRMMEFLLAGDPPMIHVQGNYCCIHTPNKCWSPGVFRANATWMQEFFELWPSHVTASLQS